MLDRGLLTPDICVPREASHSVEGSAPTTLLALDDVSFARSAQTLLSSLSLEIGAGRRTMVMGPNGAGKSLTLRLMHGLLTPSAGRVTWNGGPLDRHARRAQAMVFQKPVLLRRSVQANLRFALTLRGLSRAERRLREEEALHRARLEHLAGRPARLLSGGEQQRLAMARALSLRPEMLFLDEPTASLDPASTAAVERLICEAHASGVTIVMVTHDAGQARRLGDDILFLQDGALAEAGRADQVLAAPRSAAMRDWRAGRLHFTTHR